MFFDLRLTRRAACFLTKNMSPIFEESKFHSILYHFRFTEGSEEPRSVGMRPKWNTRKASGQQESALYSMEDTERSAAERKGSLNILLILSKNLVQRE